MVDFDSRSLIFSRIYLVPTHVMILYEFDARHFKVTMDYYGFGMVTLPTAAQ